MTHGLVRSAVVLALLLAAPGCGPTPQEQMALDQGRCASFGLTYGSPDFGRCMMDVSFQREQTESDERRARREDDALRNLAWERQKAREEAQRRAERQEYERARARREGCERVMKPIYC